MEKKSVGKKSSAKETMFWSDRIAKLIVERKKYTYIDKKIEKPKVFGVKSSTSISGVPHIGNASDVIRHDAVVRSLREMGEKVRFIWVAEDMDPLRKVPIGIPPEFKKYLGMPVSDLPCPFGCCENYVKHFVRLFIKSLRENFGTNPEMLTTTDAYKSGEFYPYIKIAIKKTDEIRQILNKYRTTPLPKVWSPWKPVCDNCGKIITTVITDVRGDVVKYKCEDYSFKEFGKEAYTKVEGCGHVGESDIAKGNGKLLWKIEWAAEWPLWKIHFEGAGKEHFMPGGSFWNAGEVCERVFNWPEPHPGKNEIQPYEYIMVDGEKMSASKGNVVATWDWPKFAPPEILRLIFIKRPNKQRGFSYTKIPNLVDDLDKLKEIYFGKKGVEDEKELRNLRRLYEMCITKPEKQYIPNVSFSFASMLAQMVPDAVEGKGKGFERTIELIEKTGQIDKFTDEVKEKLVERLQQAAVWVKNYGTERDRITLAKDVPSKTKELSDEQKKSLQKLADFLKSPKKDKEIKDEIRNIAKDMDIAPAKVFEAAYIALIGKNYGPRLVPFIQSLDRNFVVYRFRLEK